MELQDWRKEPRKKYSNEFKLRMVELASQPGACVAQIARENGVELLPVEITPDEQK
ncbi:transposase, partial [Escherichia coli]